MIRKILIVSDSHGKNRNVCEAIRREVPDMLIHLGDIENDPGEISRWLDEAASKYNRTNSTKTSDSASSDSQNNYEKSIPIPAIFIQGNCDRYGGNELRKNAVFELNDHKFFCTHGHSVGVNYGLQNLIYTAMENDCDIALYGHTHTPFDDTFESEAAGTGVRILNPGSISLPRGGSRKSYMVMTFDDDGEYEVVLKNL